MSGDDGPEKRYPAGGQRVRKQPYPTVETIIRAAMRAYPGSEEFGPDSERMSMKEILQAARDNEYGDTLAGFVVLELDEGLEGEPAGRLAARGAELMYRAAGELRSVAEALEKMAEDRGG